MNFQFIIFNKNNQIFAHVVCPTDGNDICHVTTPGGQQLFIKKTKCLGAIYLLSMMISLNLK